MFDGNYTTFKVEVSSQLDHTINASQLDNIILLGERYVNRKLRVEQMETELSVTVNSAGVATLPSDYLSAEYLYINSSPVRPLTKKTPEWLIRNYPDRTLGGLSCFVAETNSTFIFDKATAGSVVKGTYYAKPASLPGTGTINSTFSEYPEIYLWASLANAELFLGRDQRMIWQAKCDDAIRAANKEHREKKFSGGPISASPG